jgi:hypothetical protein
MKISDFAILTGKSTDELTLAVKDAIKEGWEPMEGGFQVEYLDQTAANYVCAMIKPAPTRITSARSTSGRVKKSSPAKKKTKAKK